MSTDSAKQPVSRLPTVLQCASNPRWALTVCADFDRFLIDHAACERKASAMAVSLICHYPDRAELVRSMADLALEEMAHYREVIRLIDARGLVPKGDRKDRYVNELRAAMRSDRDGFFQDRLLVAGIIEARGTERFALLADALDEPPLRDFYRRLARSEAKHHRLFFDLADCYFDATQNATRRAELAAIEARVLSQLTLRAALH